MNIFLFSNINLPLKYRGIRQEQLPGTPLVTWINSLRAKFCRGYINIYLHFMSLFHIDKTRVFKILPEVIPGPIYST